MRVSRADEQEDMKNLHHNPFLKPLVQLLRRTVLSYMGARRLKSLAGTSPCRITIGSAGIADEGWIPTEVEYLDLLKEDQWRHYFKDGSIDAILAEHVWEHLHPQEGLTAAKTCYRFLKPGAYLRVAVPDGYHPDQLYMNAVKPHGHGAGSEDHKVLFTYRSLAQLFEDTGFQVTVYEYFDEHGQFHEQDWDERKGLIRRSKRCDLRNNGNQLNYTSIIVDAIKPSP